MWRLTGAPRSAEVERAEIEREWSGEDACADNPDACAALMRSLGIDLEDDLE